MKKVRLSACDPDPLHLDEYIAQCPTLDADGYPLDVDPYLDVQADALLAEEAE